LKPELYKDFNSFRNSPAQTVMLLLGRGDPPSSISMLRT
jgi:hypothetical protein